MSELTFILSEQQEQKLLCCAFSSAHFRSKTFIYFSCILLVINIKY
jgi:hypothetical protein